MCWLTAEGLDDLKNWDHAILDKTMVVVENAHHVVANLWQSCRIFRSRDKQEWSAIACFCIVNMDFLSGCLSKYYPGPTLLYFQNLI